MRLTPIAASIMLLLTASTSYADSYPTGEQAAKGALGAVVGGVIGNQVGGGRGKTVATATGAAVGVVVASGCKVGTGTAVGGVLGGLLGSQVGGGNGKNAMAGVGASLGALFGSDCSPGASPAKPEPLPNTTPIVINGLKVTPMTGFPQEAFSGVPPIVTPADITAASKAVRMFSDIAKEADAQGDTELAILSMYWAKRIATATLAIISASLQSIETNNGSTVSIPSKGLVILPAFNEHRVPADKPLQTTMNEMLEIQGVHQASYPSDSLLVADNAGFNSAVDFLRRFSSGQPVQSAQPVETPTAHRSAKAGMPMEAIAGFPKNVVLSLPDGTQVMKTDDALTIYNPNDKAITLPLEKLDFIPRTPAPTAARQAAAELMYNIRGEQMRWVFGEYAIRSGGNFDTIVMQPNKLLDLSKGRKEIAYFSETGHIDTNPESGARSYKTKDPFKRAMDTLEAVDKTAAIRSHAGTCLSSSYSHYTALDGRYANQLQAVCFNGNYSTPQTISLKTFYLGEGKQVVQTMESLMKDKAIQKTMETALSDGKAANDLLSFAPGLGSVEGILQCAGTYTLSQYQAVAFALGGDSIKDKTILSSSKAFDIAKLSGWTPAPPEEWSLDRVSSCVGAIPLAGNTVGALKGIGKLSSKGPQVLAGLGERLDGIKTITNAFESPLTFRQYVDGVKHMDSLVPGHAIAGRLVKTVYDALMTGQGMSQTVGGMEYSLGRTTEAASYKEIDSTILASF
jgi:hypothetical protein